MRSVAPRTIAIRKTALLTCRERITGRSRETHVHPPKQRAPTQELGSAYQRSTTHDSTNSAPRGTHTTERTPHGIAWTLKLALAHDTPTRWHEYD